MIADETEVFILQVTKWTTPQQSRGELNLKRWNIALGIGYEAGVLISLK